MMSKQTTVLAKPLKIFVGLFFVVMSASVAAFNIDYQADDILDHVFFWLVGAAVFAGFASVVRGIWASVRSTRPTENGTMLAGSERDAPSIQGQETDLSPHNCSRLTENNFDLLRLLFAGTVLLVHSFEVSGFQQLGIITRVLSSAVAVKAFFVVSGFLIFMSFERSTSITAYAKKRIRRIYPAYFTVVMLCAICLVTVSSKSIGDYFSFAWIKYVFANLAFLNFLQPTLPGVFDSNKLAAVNGALWTLKIEAMFYLTVPLFVFLFRKFTHFPILLLVYCSSVAYAGFWAAVSDRTGSGVYVELGRQLPGQLSYFMAGAFLYYFLPLFERRVGYFLVPAVLVLSANTFFPLPILEPFALATVVVFVGLFLYLGNFGKYGDFSYGVYILHFPIIQLLLHSGWFRGSPWYFLTAALLITTASAIAMWHLVEKRFLFRKSHYITATSVPENAAMSFDLDALKRAP